MSLNKLQQAIAAIVLVVFAGVMAYFFVFTSKREQTLTLRSQISDLEVKISKAKGFKENARQIQASLDNLKEQLATLKKILPASILEPKIFQTIKRYANEQGLEVTNLSASKPLATKDITEHPFTFAVRGNYHDLGSFFAKLSNYPQILNIKGLNIFDLEANAAYTLSSSFIVSVFTYQEPSEEDIKARIEAKRKERTATSNPKKRGRGQ
jgi:type IV pilus assembly protein PilO